MAVVLDALSCRAQIWTIDGHSRTELVSDALDMATEQRNPEGTTHHSDQGCWYQDCRYTTIALREQYKAGGICPSIGSVGDCHLGALCESFLATFECELIEREMFSGRSEARHSIFRFIEGFYNPD